MTNNTSRNKKRTPPTNRVQSSKPTKNTFDTKNRRIRVISIIVIIALLGGVLLSVFSGMHI